MSKDNDELEVEIKLLGEKSSLTKVFRHFMSAIPTSVRDRHYSFNTYYLDTPDFALAHKGFSLRHRCGVFSIGKEAGTELKALEGSEGEISVRTELGVRGCHARINFEQLKTTRPDILQDIKGSDLQIQFATAVRRLERQAVTPFGVLLEASLDDMEILVKEGTTGSDLYDVILFPLSVEHELEFELKGEYHRSDAPLQSLAWIKHQLIKQEDVRFSTESKASRVLKNLLH